MKTMVRASDGAAWGAAACCASAAETSLATSVPAAAQPAPASSERLEMIPDITPSSFFYAPPPIGAADHRAEPAGSLAASINRSAASFKSPNGSAREPCFQARINAARVVFEDL